MLCTQGMKQCRYEWIARMDSDDISLPTRFEKQLEYLASTQRSHAHFTSRCSTGIPENMSLYNANGFHLFGLYG